VDLKLIESDQEKEQRLLEDEARVSLSQEEQECVNNCSRDCEVDCNKIKAKEDGEKVIEIDRFYQNQSNKKISNINNNNNNSFKQIDNKNINKRSNNKMSTKIINSFNDFDQLNIKNKNIKHSEKINTIFLK